MKLNTSLTSSTLVDAFTGAPEEFMLFCGMGIGVRDPDHPVNALRSERAPLEEWVTVL